MLYANNIVLSNLVGLPNKLKNIRVINRKIRRYKRRVHKSLGMSCVLWKNKKNEYISNVTCAFRIQDEHA